MCLQNCSSLKRPSDQPTVRLTAELNKIKMVPARLSGGGKKKKWRGVAGLPPAGPGHPREWKFKYLTSKSVGAPAHFWASIQRRVARRDEMGRPKRHYSRKCRRQAPNSGIRLRHGYVACSETSGTAQLRRVEPVGVSRSQQVAHNKWLASELAPARLQRLEGERIIIIIVIIFSLFV